MIPKFVMMVGIAGSGKSTTATEIAAELNGVIISSDAIRGELYGDEAIQGDYGYVFQLMEERTMDALRAGRSVIYDATNVSAWRRQEFLAKLPVGIERVCIWINTSLARSLRNNRRRDRHVPEWVIRRQAEQLDPPIMAEVWDELRIITTY